MRWKWAAFVLGAWFVAGMAVAAVWDTGTFEASPGDSDPIAQGADKIRETRLETRERAQADLCWGTVDADGCVAGDSGRLRKGAARVFHQPAVPTVLNAMDQLGSTTLDPGRVFIDSDGLDNTDTNADDHFPAAVFDSIVGFHQIGTVPPLAIIMWDQTTGDENCDGTPVADECPCGYDEVTAMRGVLPRGTDVGAVIAGIPDDAGIACPGGVGCSGTATEYDDTLDIAELPAHHHSTEVGANVVGGGGNPTVADDADDDGAGETGDTGGATAHYHPLYSMLFCRFNGSTF